MKIFIVVFIVTSNESFFVSFLPQFQRTGFVCLSVCVVCVCVHTTGWFCKSFFEKKEYLEMRRKKVFF